MTTINPYAAPRAAVADETLVLNADFVPGGQARPAGRGWTWITEGWEIFRRQPGMWIGLWVVFMVIFLPAGSIPFLGSVLTALFWPVFMAGIAIGCRAVDQGGRLELGHLFAGFREGLATLVGVGAISFGAALVVGVIVGLGFGASVFARMGTSPETMAAVDGMTLTLIVLIMLALMLPVVMAIWFAPLLVAFQQQGAWEGMKQSFAGCLKNIVPFLIYGVIAVVPFLIFGAIYLSHQIVGWIVFGLSMLVLGPVLSASVYTAYRDIYLKPQA
jgi:hypothetical protein